MSDLLIRNCKVLDITSDGRVSILQDHDILISGNRIEAVQPTGQADVSHFREVIEADGLVLDGLEEPGFGADDANPARPLSWGSMWQMPPIMAGRMRPSA